MRVKKSFHFNPCVALLFLLVPRRCRRFREVFGPKLALLNPFADRVVKPSNNRKGNREKTKMKMKTSKKHIKKQSA